MISLDIKEREYVQNTSWLVKENANTNKSAIGLMYYSMLEATIDQIYQKLPQDAVKLHKEAYIHIHKIRDGAWYIPYCSGHDPTRLLTLGLKTPSIESKPPKHLDSAIDQLINFIMVMSQERSGSISLNLIDLFLAPFIRFDHLSYEEVKQQIQRFIYNLNYTTRLNYQTPFSNIVLGFSLPDLDKIVVYHNGRPCGHASEYLDEILMIVRALCEVYLEGDAKNRPFTFPIPTIIYTRELEKYTDILDLIWKVTAERGQFYFLNSYLTDRTGIFSMCCRLTIDLRKVMDFIHQSRGLWSLPPATGSIGYVSINLPRIGFEMLEHGYDEKYIYDRLLELMLVGRRVLNVLRQRYYQLFKKGLYPMTKIYVDPIDPFKYYFNTIATVGLSEFIPIVLRDPDLWKKEIDVEGRELKNNIVKVMGDVLSFMLDVLKEFEQEDHVLYNLEQAPAESASTKFAFSDYMKYPKYRKYIPKINNSANGFVEGEEIPFYTSMNTPPYCTYRLETQIWIEAETQKLYTGGVIKHIFVHRPLPAEYVGELIRRIIHNYDIVYMTYTPTQSVCPNCGYRTIDIVYTCPKCGCTNMEIWSRIVGYYRPIQTWNIGKLAEFYTRRSL